jgi:glutathione S-transferase
MITLYQFTPSCGLPNLSAFCMKVEVYLRMAGLPYRTAVVDLRKAPKGKAPYINDNGRIIADSGFIIDYLKAHYGDSLDEWLSPEQRASALALQRMMEEHLYWALVHCRWLDDDNWQMVKRGLFGDLPVPLRWFIPALARQQIKKELWGHGMGRHSREEIHALGKRDITALADFLGNKPYFLGDQPCSLDATAYAFLANTVWAPFPSPLRDEAQSYPQIDAYCQRMKARYFSTPA